MEATLRAAPTGRSFLGLQGPERVWLLTCGLFAGGLVLLVAGVARLEPFAGPMSLPWWALAVLFYLGEVKVVHLQSRRMTHSFTLSDVPLVVGLFLASPTDLVLANVVGAGAGLLIHRRPTAIKWAFNVALFFVGAEFAAVVFHGSLALLDTATTLSPLTWVATFAATITANMVGLAAVNAAIRMVQSRVDGERLPAAIRIGLIVAFTNTALALIGVTLLARGAEAAWLAIIPLTLLAVAYRSYRAVATEREQQESLELLYSATRILHGTTDLPEAIEQVLRLARQRFRAEVAEVILFTNEAATEGLRSTIGPDGFHESMNEVELLPATDALRLRAVRDRKGFMAPRLGRGEERNDRAARRQIRDAMVAPLLGERRLIGTFLIANREAHLGAYREDDLLLFETLANHAGVALENGELGRSLKQTSDLKEQLRYQAFHDELTGIPNRSQFLDRLQAAMERRDSDDIVPAVLFIDLDDFKTVNDRYGHAAGDELLKTVAARLRGCVRPGDLAARLGGDEFALLVEDGRDLGAVIRIAERVIDSVRRPARVGANDVSTRASVGIATAGPGVDDLEALMRDADIAMYTAKTRGKGRFALFDPSMEEAVSARESLRLELGHGVDREELTLRYQPICDLRSGATMGVEALVRWQHPTRGLLQPDEFMALAEESGLSVPLGRWVLSRACRQARIWRDQTGMRAFSLSVNISGRQLQHPSFVHEVAAILRDEGFPAECLVLEISETVLANDAPGVEARMEALKRLGVRFAIDDFGSGVSSLGRLGRGPIDVLKIARPFVDSLDGGDDGARIADAIVALGHSLGLTVVAEGIERPGQLAHLQALDCDRGQGFLLSRPLDVPGVTRMLDMAAAA